MINQLQKTKIEEELLFINNKLKGMSYSELKLLDGFPLADEKEIEGKIYEFSSWSEPAINAEDGVLAVLTDVWKKHVIGSARYMKGFLLDHSGNVVDLTECELWEYD
ncbi:MAG: hypothetical protein BWK73_45630 [Thiothrix lacustris]|uniref:Uncharacterized protein n=1 Tax=Thiothrix lacustris TaxID=525917 RepID=A0A1Y1QB40_9GAMM|nr:MAG: hypothetical protein BWK73_45630 [Thiothrix lacustris]